MSILNETRMSFKEACVFFNRGAVTLRVWIRHGFRGVRLESIKIGSSVITSKEAIERFVAATNAPKGGEKP